MKGRGRYDNDDDSNHNSWMLLRDLRHLNRRSPYLGACTRQNEGAMIELPSIFLALILAVLIISAHVNRSKIFV